MVRECVYLIGREGNKEVSCKTNLETMRNMGAETADPLFYFGEKRPFFESIFSKLWDLGQFDEWGEITFSTGLIRCPKVSA
jgi:hypothetical protein